MQLIICSNVCAQYFRTKFSPLHFKMLSPSGAKGFAPRPPPETLPLEPTGVRTAVTAPKPYRLAVHACHERQRTGSFFDPCVYTAGTLLTVITHS